MPYYLRDLKSDPNFRDVKAGGKGLKGSKPGARRHVRVSDDGHTVGGGVDLTQPLRWMI